MQPRGQHARAPPTQLPLLLKLPLRAPGSPSPAFFWATPQHHGALTSPPPLTPCTGAAPRGGPGRLGAPRAPGGRPGGQRPPHLAAARRRQPHRARRRRCCRPPAGRPPPPPPPPHRAGSRRRKEGGKGKEGKGGARGAPPPPAARAAGGGRGGGGVEPAGGGGKGGGGPGAEGRPLRGCGEGPGLRPPAAPHGAPVVRGGTGPGCSRFLWFIGTPRGQS